MVTLKKDFFSIEKWFCWACQNEKNPKFTFNHRVIGIYKFLSKTNIHDLGQRQLFVAIDEKSLFFRQSFFSDFPLLHCTELHCTAQHCTAVQCTALHCTALHCTELYCTALHSTAMYYITLRSLHCTALHYTALSALHCTALHCAVCTALHCTALYNTTLL